MGDSGRKDLIETQHISADELATIHARSRLPSETPRISLLIYHPDGVQAIPLSDGKSIVVGRFPPADVAIRDASLSRQHATVELSGGDVWIEDLQSTNGTWVGGQRIERAKVAPGTEVAFGAVSAAVHSVGAASAGIDSHDAFIARLEAEVARAKAYGRALSLVMVRADRAVAQHVHGMLDDLRPHLRRFDVLALYAADTLEVLLPETGEEDAREVARRVCCAEGMACGVAGFPQHGASAAELLDVGRAALMRADAAEPVRVAESSGRSIGRTPTADGGPVARSDAMRRVLETAQQLASSPIPVLILGETGTGKEVVARVLHHAGRRRDKELIYVNCGAIPAQLVESTLFGHEKGAFTGAIQRASGVFEAAHGGTVLLDEVGELPITAQAALLRVIDTKRFTRVGSSREITVDVRVLAATHRDLAAMCDQGDFRRDLLYRLNGFSVEVPPLRERPDDIEALAVRFVAEANAANGRDVRRIHPRALEILRAYNWPGNVRELRNTIERAVVIAPEDVITIDDLPLSMRCTSGIAPAAPQPPPATNGSSGFQEINLRAELDRIEADHIRRALNHTGWDRNEAARLLGLPLRTLARKIRAHGLKRA